MKCLCQTKYFFIQNYDEKLVQNTPFEVPNIEQQQLEECQIEQQQTQRNYYKVTIVSCLCFVYHSSSFYS